MKASQKAPSVQQFASVAADAFAFLAKHGFVKESSTAVETGFQVAFVGERIRLVVEGVNWGLNARLGFGHSPPLQFEDYDFDDLIEPEKRAKRGSIAGGSTQLDQVRWYAATLCRDFPELLVGDPALFERAARARAIRERTIRYRPVSR